MTDYERVVYCLLADTRSKEFLQYERETFRIEGRTTDWRRATKGVTPMTRATSKDVRDAEQTLRLYIGYLIPLEDDDEG